MKLKIKTRGQHTNTLNDIHCPINILVHAPQINIKCACSLQSHTGNKKSSLTHRDANTCLRKLGSHHPHKKG